MQKRHKNLMTKLDSNVELMIQKFQNILERSTILDKSQETLAIETLQIEADASTIIRLAEELLSISRTLKESWILGQLPQIEQVEDQKGLYEKVNKLLDTITNGDAMPEVEPKAEPQTEVKTEVTEEVNTEVTKEVQAEPKREVTEDEDVSMD